MFTDLVKPETLSELIAKYEQKMRDFTAFWPHYEKCKDFLVGYHRRANEVEKEATLNSIQKNAWRGVIDKTGLYSLMSLSAAEKLKKVFYGTEKCNTVGIPEFTYENVIAFIEAQRQAIPSMVDEKIIEVYKLLRPNNYYKVLKTNNISLFEGIGYKVILSYYFEENYSGGLRIKYQKREEANAIQEIFWLLDGRGVAKDEQKLYHKMHGAERGDAYEDEYFRVKGYKNGNMHLEFKRMDLVKKIVATAREKIIGKVA